MLGLDKVEHVFEQKIDKKSDYQFITYGKYMVDRSDGLDFMFLKC